VALAVVKLKPTSTAVVAQGWSASAAVPGDRSEGPPPRLPCRRDQLDSVQNALVPRVVAAAQPPVNNWSVLVPFPRIDLTTVLRWAGR